MLLLNVQFEIHSPRTGGRDAELLSSDPSIKVLSLSMAKYFISKQY